MPEIISDHNLKNLTTMRCGGNAKFFAEPADTEELKEAIHYDEILARETRPMEIFMVSVTKKIGFTHSQTLGYGGSCCDFHFYKK